MTITLEDAIILAADLHRGQTDKAGAPYILHPLRVMMNLGAQATPDERIVAVLHDVLEDCDIMPQQLREQGYSPQVLAALELLTKREEDDYQQFIERCAPNAIARRVKLADLQDNMDLSRIAQPTARDYERHEKYQRAKEYLNQFETVAP